MLVQRIIVFQICKYTLSIVNKMKLVYPIMVNQILIYENFLHGAKRDNLPKLEHTLCFLLSLRPHGVLSITKSNLQHRARSNLMSTKWRPWKCEAASLAFLALHKHWDSGSSATCEPGHIRYFWYTKTIATTGPYVIFLIYHNH